jgi:hypothetical protein
LSWVRLFWDFGKDSGHSLVCFVGLVDVVLLAFFLVDLVMGFDSLAWYCWIVLSVDVLTFCLVDLVMVFVRVSFRVLVFSNVE